MKENPDFSSIPVIVLTLRAPRRISFDSYQLHCNCYVTKPVNFDRFSRMCPIIEHFVVVVVLPVKE